MVTSDEFSAQDNRDVIESSSFQIPLRGLNEFVYCPRLFHLMYVQGLFEDNLDTVAGRINHSKRMEKTKSSHSESPEEENAVPWSPALVRQITLSSEKLGITGKFDVVLTEGSAIVPVEVKRGHAPDGNQKFIVGHHELSGEAWGNDQVQLAGQVALLREAGHDCHMGRVYYQQSKKLVELQFDENLNMALAWTTENAVRLFGSEMPDPLEDSRKCIRCSMNFVCLPDETHQLRGRLEEPRQLYPGRDDTGVLHLTIPGTVVGKTGSAIKVRRPDSGEVSIPMHDVAHICCWGNIQLTTQALLTLADHGIGITWLSSGGWLRAVTSAPLGKNVCLRREQYRKCDDQEGCLHLARWIVSAKIENQRVIIRRNRKEGALQEALDALKKLKDEADTCQNTASLRGIEGYAAKLYWSAFSSLLMSKPGKRFSMAGRNKRPPKDPINALLSYGYSMLVRDFVTAIHATGLDPYYGFYHVVQAGRPALALDLMEPFRPIIVDSAVLRSVNEGIFSENDFIQAPGFCTMKPKAKTDFIRAYERRVDQLVTHPVFGYRVSYRRMISVESRLFGRHLTGELPVYRPMTTR